MNYWLHRISHHAKVSYPLLENGYLTIGFSDLTSNPSELYSRVKGNDRPWFDKQFKLAWGKTPRSRHYLWRFVEMAVGDLVIVPSWKSFIVCEVLDDNPILVGQINVSRIRTWNDKTIFSDQTLLYDEKNQSYDLGFARRIKILHSGISREKYADSKLTSRLKFRGTNSKINDLSQSIKKSIKNYKAQTPIHLHSLLLEKTAHLFLEVIRKELNDRKFEKLLKLYFISIGANEVRIPARNERDKEGDGDIVAVFEKLKLIIYIQAKFHKGITNEWAINQINDYTTSKDSIDDGYNRIAWVISTADDFNQEAKNLAKENGIQLINGIEFSGMLVNSGINILDTSL